MKSTKAYLISRGWVDPDTVAQYLDFVPAQLGILLHSHLPFERTLAVKIISIKRIKKFIPELCAVLISEKKLYTKIAISQCLSGFGAHSIKYLIPLLGKIGKNQHKELPSKLFGKNNYPLPRDIAARILIRIGTAALPMLEEVLQNGEDYQKSEAIDAIGFIAFYEKDKRSLPFLLNLFKKCRGKNDLLEWKIIRAFSAFYTSQTAQILHAIIKNEKNDLIRNEALRSLKQIKMSDYSAKNIIE